MTTPGRRVRIAVLNSHPIQYFAPLYAYLNASPDIEVTALYCSDFSLRGGYDRQFQRPVTWDVDLLAGYRSVFLGPRAKVRMPGGFFSLIVPEVWREVRSGRYDALWLHGHGYAANLIALVAAKTRGIPVLMRCETHLGLARGPIKRRLRSVLLRLLYRACDRFLAIGTANAAFYRAMGVPGDRIFLVPYSVDNARFIDASRLSDAARAAARRALGLREGVPVVLYASKLTTRKHPDDLVRAAALLRRRGLDFDLLMVGSGELEDALRAMVRSHGLDGVVFAGFVNQTEMPRMFGVSDVFVLPSENEPWGLIVNEALCAGLPVVVTEGTGCAPDLVKDGLNGRVVAAGEVEALAAALHPLVADAHLRGRMGEAGRAIIARWGFADCLGGLRRAVAGDRGNATQPALAS